MRKVFVHPDGTIGLEVSDELTEAEEKILLRLSDAKARRKVKLKQNLTTKDKELRKEFVIPATWKFIIERETQSKRGGQSTYALYNDTTDGSIIGVVKPSNAKTDMGNPNDPNSIIAQIMKAVNSMALHSKFTRTKLREVLPPKLYRGDYLKSALDYMEHLGMIKNKGKELGSGAIQYERLDSSNKAEPSRLEPLDPHFKKIDRLL